MNFTPSACSSIVAVEVLQIGGRVAEGPVDVVGQLNLQLGVDAVAKCIHVAQHLHDAREVTGPALLVHASGIEVGHRGNKFDLVFDVDVLEMRVFGVVQDDEVRAHDHLLGDPGRLPDEPLELRVHLGEPPVMSMTLNPPVSKAASTASMVSRVMHSSFLGEQDR